MPVCCDRNQHISSRQSASDQAEVVGGVTCQTGEVSRDKLTRPPPTLPSTGFLLT